MKIFNLLFVLIAGYLFGCHYNHTNCTSNPNTIRYDEFYSSLEKSNYSTCSYEPTHYFFCDVGSNTCEDYIKLTTSYFIEKESHDTSNARSAMKQKYKYNGLLNELINKVRNNEDILHIANPKEPSTAWDSFIVPVNKGIAIEFIISAEKITDPNELRNLHFVTGESPNEERPRPQEILPKYCPDGGTDCLEAFITDYRLQEPKNKQEIYMFGIISRGNSKEHNAVLQGLYDRIQQSDILFRGQMLGTRLICDSLAKKNEVTIKDKIPLRLNFEESLKQLDEERKNEERKSKQLENAQ